MVAPALQQPPASWAAWPQYNTDPSFGYPPVDGHGILPHEPQPYAAELVQRQQMSMQYPTTNVYGPPLVTRFAAGESSYHPEPTMHMTGHFEPPGMLPPSPHSFVQHSASPQGAGELTACEVKLSPQALHTETKASPSTSQGGNAASKLPKASPGNPVDSVMAVIQSKPFITEIVKKTGALSITKQPSPKHRPADTATGKRRRAPAVKRHPCDWEGCDKSFANKAQLTNHIRSHTGEKPYRCGMPGCDKSFSQSGNRKTHWEAHMGNARFKCPICGRGFTSKGNVKPHIETHNPEKRWVCPLDGCNRTFSIKGNLKNHQAKFHSQKLAEVQEQFYKINDPDSVSPEDLELLIYLYSVHCNANKGIKGCQGSRIRRLTQPAPCEMSPPSSPSSTGSYQSPMEFSPLSSPSPTVGYSTPYQVPSAAQWQFPGQYGADYCAPYRYPNGTYDLSGHIVDQEADVHIDISMYGAASCASVTPHAGAAPFDVGLEQRNAWGRRY